MSETESSGSSALLYGKRGLVLGVSSKDSVGFHAAQQLRVGANPCTGRNMAELQAAVIGQCAELRGQRL